MRQDGRQAKSAKPLYDDNGELVLRAAPIVSYDKWAKVQARLNWIRNWAIRVLTPHPLCVAYCGNCEVPCTSSRPKTARATGRTGITSAAKPTMVNAPQRDLRRAAGKADSRKVLEYAGSCRI